ncbi:MAG: hypothetical protein H6722_30860 [Sandaracinus sp.]|nr:hypothetical protein [Sandaracinus sp.]
MTDASAGQHFPCGSCGAPAMQFDASVGAMRCPYCNHTQAVAQQAQPHAAPAPQAEGQAPAQPTPAPGPGGAVERRLEEGIAQERSGAGGTGFGTATRSMRCQTCGATVAFSDAAIATKCDFCGSQHVLEQQSQRNVIRPESLVPFAVNDQVAKQKFQEWLGSGFFRPSNLSSAASLGQISGVYVPYWTFDCGVDSQWRAESGHHYYETVVEAQVVNGQKQEVKRQVQKTRWQPAQGHRRDRYDDVLVVASKGLPEPIANRLATFDTNALVPYDPRYLAGFHAEEYAVGLEEGWQKADQRIRRDQDSRCQRDIPGDTHRNFQSQHQLYEQTYKHVLLPLWIAAYRYQDKTFRFLVNGQTGEVQGEAPTSWFKVVMVIAIVVAIIAGIVFAVRASKGG